MVQRSDKSRDAATLPDRSLLPPSVESPYFVTVRAPVYNKMKRDTMIDRINYWLTRVDGEEVDFDAAFYKSIGGSDRNTLGPSRSEMSNDQSEPSFHCGACPLSGPVIGEGD
jgi:hypothetical protein